jgi:hypothetical protein
MVVGLIELGVMAIPSADASCRLRSRLRTTTIIDVSTTTATTSIAANATTLSASAAATKATNIGRLDAMTNHTTQRAASGVTSRLGLT